MEHPDFYEGVRALIIEKDNKPQWAPKELKQISNEQIMNFFKPTQKA